MNTHMSVLRELLPLRKTIYVVIRWENTFVVSQILCLYPPGWRIREFDTPRRIAKTRCLNTSYSDTTYDVRWHCGTILTHIDLCRFVSFPLHNVKLECYSDSFSSKGRGKIRYPGDSTYVTWVCSNTSCVDMKFFLILLSQISDSQVLLSPKGRKGYESCLASPRGVRFRVLLTSPRPTRWRVQGSTRSHLPSLEERGVTLHGRGRPCNRRGEVCISGSRMTNKIRDVYGTTFSFCSGTGQESLECKFTSVCL